MDKYKKLISNTLIFAVGSFGSKILVLVLNPLYAYVMNPGEYGIATMTIQMGNLLLPVVGLGIVEAIIRFGLERSVRKSDVFTTGLVTILSGWAVLMILQTAFLSQLKPLFLSLGFGEGFTDQNLYLMDFFLLASCLRSLCNQFVRVKGMVKLFAVNGVLSTAAVVGFAVLYLLVLKMGVPGFILMNISADVVSILFLVVTAALPKYVRFKNFHFQTAKDMLKYSIPMMPNTIFWWITTSSSQFIISFLMSESDTGLFNTANKVPQLIVLVSGFFMDAWQMSAVTEERTRARFFSKVFGAYTSVIFVAAACIVPFSKIFTIILTGNKASYYESWRFIPFLILSTVFTCLVNFMGSVYMVNKKSTHSLATAAIGAVCNVGLNFWLVPIMGVNGAALGMMLSYAIVFIVRAWDANRYIHMRWSVLRMGVNIILVFAECAVILLELPLWPLWEALLIIMSILCNYKEILDSIQKVLPAKFRRTKSH